MEVYGIPLVVLGILAGWYTVNRANHRHPGQMVPCFVHHWKTVGDTIVHQYQTCTKCGARRIKRVSWGAQPIDSGWLRTGQWTEMQPPAAKPIPPRGAKLEPGPSNIIVRTPYPAAPPKDVSRQGKFRWQK